MSLGSWLWGSVLPRLWVDRKLRLDQEESQAHGGEAEGPFFPEVQTEPTLFSSFPSLRSVSQCPSLRGSQRVCSL